MQSDFNTTLNAAIALKPTVAAVRSIAVYRVALRSCSPAQLQLLTHSCFAFVAEPTAIGRSPCREVRAAAPKTK